MRPPIGSRWYFGWNIVAAAAVLTLLSTGMRLGIGPYFLPMAQDLGFGRTQLAAIMAGAMLCYGAAMPIVGVLVTRYGTRRVMLAGALIVVLSALWTAGTRDPLAFLLAYGLCFSVGLACTSPVALTPIISHWFTRRRGLAMFLLTTGSMAGMAVMTPAMALAIDAIGWRATLVGCAGLLAACSVAAAVFVMRDIAPVSTDLLPEEAAAQRALQATLPQPLEPGDAVRTRPFWRLAFGMACCGFSMNLLGVHGVPLLVDRGFGPFHAAMAIGVVGLAAIAGTVVLGGMADRVPRRNLLAIVYLVRGAGFFALLLAASSVEVYFAAAVMGLVWAGSTALTATIIGDVYGVRLVGVLYGIAYFGHQLGAALGSFLGGWAHEHFGTHWIAFGTAGALLLTAGVISLQLPYRTRLVLPPRTAPAR